MQRRLIRLSGGTPYRGQTRRRRTISTHRTAVTGRDIVRVTKTGTVTATARAKKTGTVTATVCVTQTRNVTAIVRTVMGIAAGGRAIVTTTTTTTGPSVNTEHGTHHRGGTAHVRFRLLLHDRPPRIRKRMHSPHRFVFPLRPCTKAVAWLCAARANRWSLRAGARRQGLVGPLRLSGEAVLCDDWLR